MILQHTRSTLTDTRFPYTTLFRSLQKHIADLKPAAVSAFFNGKPYVAAEIADLASHRPLFRQPAVLLAYYLVVRIPNQLRACWPFPADELQPIRSEEHTSELQSLMRHSYAVFCLNKKQKYTT